MTVSDIAEYLGVSRQYIHTIRSKFKTGHRLGSHVVFSRQEIEVFAKNRKAKLDAKDQVHSA